MLLRVVDDGEFRDIPIEEGEMFLLPGRLLHLALVKLSNIHPGNTPHNPVRFADTIGIVIERIRPPDAIGTYLESTAAPDRMPIIFTDGLRWYCREPVHETPIIIREERFHCTDLGTQLKPLIDEWMNNAESRKCGTCGVVAAAK
jgi:3-hydroxyanthranilate 3,4-dioxygenase